MLEYMIEMRHMCYVKNKLTKHDILLNLTQSEEETRKFSYTCLAGLGTLGLLAFGIAGLMSQE